MKKLNLFLATAMTALLGLLAGPAMAQTADNPIITMLESISLTGVAAAVAAICLVVIAIKLTFKGPDVASRVIRKV